jgi:hypothetical protein
MKRPALWLAILLVLVTDAVVLVGAWRNRSGAPSTVIELTERELLLNAPAEENSGVSLRLNWIGQWYFGANTNKWFDHAKLAELGFDTSLPPNDAAAEIHYRHVLPRQAFIALEYDGEAWQSWLSQQRELTKIVGNVGDENSPSSHLVAVDTAADPARLFERYPDRKKYLVVRGVVRLMLNRTRDTQGHGYAFLQGTVTEILPGEIHVSLPLARLLAKPPKHYTVGLAYGKYFEPWVVSVRVTGE